jgi:hypothetical protein
VTAASTWTESVFHVLAHVEAHGLAASCYNPTWITWASAELGPLEERALATDVAVIARTVTTHDELARVQALAWVFEAASDVERVADRELDTLGAEDVASSEALTIARAAGPNAEVVRAAAELELPRLAAIGRISRDSLEAIERALDEVAPAAPSLPRFEVVAARPLGLRGRALGSTIVVGVPGIGCPDPAHAAWQAAHEATVSEIASVRDVPFIELERKAIALLRSRARAAGLGDAHALWLSRLDLRALGAIPDVDDPSE